MAEGKEGEDPWVKNGGQKGKRRGPGFYYGQPVASLERFSWNRDKRHRLKYPDLIAAEIAARRGDKDRRDLIQALSTARAFRSE